MFGQTWGVKKRSRFLPEQRQKLLEEFQQSGLTVTEFARRNGIGRSLLSVWLQRYVRPPAAVPAPVSAPVEVPLREISFTQLLGQPSWAAELVLAGGLTLRLDAHGQAHLLALLAKRLTL